MGSTSHHQAVEIDAAGEVFVCASVPETRDGKSVPALLEQALAASAGAAPSLFYWDARLDPGPGELHLGRGGLDPLLASSVDLSACVAVSRRLLRLLEERGAGRLDEDLGEAAALLARYPGQVALWCDGLLGRVDPSVRPRGFSGDPTSHADAITIALIIEEDVSAVPDFLAAIGRQTVQADIELVAVSLGLASPAVRELAHLLEGFGLPGRRVRFRRYSLSGPIPRTYLANVAVGLASADAVVVADPRCRPVTPEAIQKLSDWCLSGDVVAACPLVLFGDRLVSAGLALARPEGEGEGGDRIVPWCDRGLPEVLRTALAPAPGLFAVRRNAWLAAGGLRGLADPDLWTAELAFASGPRGRTLLAGTEAARWAGPERPAFWRAATPAQPLQPSAGAAARDPRAPLDADLAADAPPEALRFDLVPAGPPPGELFAFKDPPGGPGALKLLVFADNHAASQSIAFVDGLAGARGRGDASVHIVEEALFPGDSRALRHPSSAELVERLFDETRPDVAVVSRFAHGGAWDALRAAARRRGTPILFHLDDDIFDLPANLGIERYRLGRNASRMRTLRRSLAEADVVLAATPALAARLAHYAGHGRVVALTHGTAGRPPQPSRPSGPDLIVGYMGSASHDHDLAMIAPALNRVAAAYPHVRISLFGSIAEQPAARLLEGPVERHAPVLKDYGAFRRRLAELGFDIGLSPLRTTPFNALKTATKWVEYTEAGAVCLASCSGPYRPIVEAGGAVGAEPHQWEAALRRLIESETLRRLTLDRASDLVSARFSWEALESEMLGVLEGCLASGRAA